MTDEQQIELAAGHELRRMAGDVALAGPVAYCEQVIVFRDGQRFTIFMTNSHEVAEAMRTGVARRFDVEQLEAVRSNEPQA